LPPQFTQKPASTVTSVPAGFEKTAKSTAECGSGEAAISGGAVTGTQTWGPSLSESDPSPKPAAGVPATKWETEVYQTASGQLETSVAEASTLQAFVMCTPTPPKVEFEEITTAGKKEV
jgi:hypothetical protein